MAVTFAVAGEGRGKDHLTGDKFKRRTTNDERRTTRRSDMPRADSDCIVVTNDRSNARPHAQIENHSFSSFVVRPSSFDQSRTRRRNLRLPTFRTAASPGV